ncbi:hypothetical protein [Paracoccus sphaerophysae]|uniref:hypothetical protein n=1 Tax=Paracoccus sphaerophysae TaxID=690417 RepID=UPI0023535D03|nr:hypothetical protein [Paracoccus sphaerophysae]
MADIGNAEAGLEEMGGGCLGVLDESPAAQDLSREPADGQRQIRRGVSYKFVVGRRFAQPLCTGKCDDKLVPLRIVECVRLKAVGTVDDRSEDSVTGGAYRIDLDVMNAIGTLDGRSYLWRHKLPISLS